MPIVTSHASGTFCWPELYTNDPVGARRFYAELLGWDVREIPLGPGQVYTVFTLNGADAAACYGNVPDLYEVKLPPHWMPYVAVDNADLTAITAIAAGGRVLKAPFDVPMTGRMAVLRDPTGAVFCVWQDKGKPGIGIVREPGALHWTELVTGDTEAAARFYQLLFGWRRELWPSPDEPAYHLFDNGGVMAGGMTTIAPETPAMRPVWAIYFQVEDCEDTVERARGLGGRLTVAVQTVPGVGTFAFVADPTGAHFGVMQPATA
jgi:predicted enzyme related to lactoylglutathione lyase